MVDLSVLIYSLAPETHPNGSYYSSVEKLATEVLREMEKSFRPILELQPVAFAERAYLDLLLLGVYARRGAQADEQPSLEQLNYALEQLQQSRNYHYQIQRLGLWQEFIMEQSRPTCTIIWQIINGFTDWFVQHSTEVLGVYTAQVHGYLATFQSTTTSNALFCTSSVLEYHVNMVGAEILNRLWQKSFADAKQHLLVLPGCLRANSVSCTSLKWILGSKCGQCNQGCQINELSQLGERYGFQVCFVQHQSSLVSHMRNLNELEKQGSLGILGVACVLSLLEGGFMLEANKVPGQCVPLDYCGCANWQSDGFTTEVSVERVLDLMEVG